MNDVIRIHEPVKQLCDLLGLKYDCVAELIVRPGDVVATILLENDDGKKYVDLATNKAASEQRTFRVIA